MKDIDKKTKLVLESLFDFIVPEGMSAEERTSLAKSAGVNPESLRVMRRRKTLNADTLVRLLLARGVSLNFLQNMPQTDFKNLSSGEAEWLQLGRELTEAEKKEFAGLIRFIRLKWTTK